MVLISVNCYFGLSVMCFSINASVTSSTESTKSKTVIVMEKEKIWLQLNQFTSKVFMLTTFFCSFVLFFLLP